MRRLTTAHPSPRAVGEQTLDAFDPCAHRPKCERVGAGGVRRGHSSNRTKRGARRIDGETQSSLSCNAIDLATDRAWSNDDATFLHPRRVEVFPSGEVD